MMASTNSPSPIGIAEQSPTALHRTGTEPASTLEQLRRENDELRQAIQARDEFISVAAHELRNPMTPLIAQIELLQVFASQAGAAVPERVSKGLDRLNLMASRYLKRATTLLDISRLTSDRFYLEPDRLDAAALVREVAEARGPYAARAGCALSVSVTGSFVGLWDRLAIEQIADNLLSNAIKYGVGKPIALTLSREDDLMRLSVADQGVGISADDQARIFDRFERAVTRERAGGFGVGLWVVGRLVGIMGGRISVDSEPGAGSTFTIRLPINTEAEE